MHIVDRKEMGENDQILENAPELTQLVMEEKRTGSVH